METGYRGQEGLLCASMALYLLVPAIAAVWAGTSIAEIIGLL
jgi:hypothetical protein